MECKWYKYNYSRTKPYRYIKQKNTRRKLLSTASATRQGSVKDNYFLTHDGKYDRLTLKSYLNYKNKFNYEAQTEQNQTKEIQKIKK